MKRVKILFPFLTCLFFVCFIACEKGNGIIDERIPLEIETDFTERFPAGEIKALNDYSGYGTYRIDFMDKDRNLASVWYQDGVWKMTHTKISDINQLTTAARFAFAQSEYSDAQVQEIYKTEREGISKSLYTLQFPYRWKHVEDISHYAFINDDGLYLTSLMSRPNDTECFVNLPKSHFDFIYSTYKDAEIRGFINNAGSNEYFILHEGVIKSVYFRGSKPDELGFWDKTEYELSLDTQVPENVISFLRHNHPEFTYTNLYYIESFHGNAYFFKDRNHKNDLGYTIREDISKKAER